MTVGADGLGDSPLTSAIKDARHPAVVQKLLQDYYYKFTEDHDLDILSPHTWDLFRQHLNDVGVALDVEFKQS